MSDDWDRVQAESFDALVDAQNDWQDVAADRVAYRKGHTPQEAEEKYPTPQAYADILAKDALAGDVYGRAAAREAAEAATAAKRVAPEPPSDDSGPFDVQKAVSEGLAEIAQLRADLDAAMKRYGGE